MAIIPVGELILVFLIVIFSKFKFWILPVISLNIEFPFDIFKLEIVYFCSAVTFLAAIPITGFVIFSKLIFPVIL